MFLAPPIIIDGLNLKTCQNFVGTKFILTLHYPQIYRKSPLEKT